MTTPAIRLVAIRETPLRRPEVLAAVEDDAAGGVMLFVGIVRDHDDARAVAGLDYSRPPHRDRRLREVRRGRRRPPPCHRARSGPPGRVSSAIGDLAVVVAAAAAHRGQAFDASRDLIDDLKATVPIWKHQRFADGDEEWVGTP